MRLRASGPGQCACAEACMLYILVRACQFLPSVTTLVIRADEIAQFVPTQPNGSSLNFPHMDSNMPSKLTYGVFMITFLRVTMYRSWKSFRFAPFRNGNGTEL